MISAEAMIRADPDVILVMKRGADTVGGRTVSSRSPGSPRRRPGDIAGRADGRDEDPGVRAGRRRGHRRPGEGGLSVKDDVSVAEAACDNTSLRRSAQIRLTRSIAIIVGMLIALAVLVVISAGGSKVAIAPSEVLGSLAHHWHLDIGPLPTHENGEETLWNVRFPRIVLGLIVGAGLGAGGCLLQGVLANPLAEPGIVGVSSGAAIGACLIIVLGGSGSNEWALAGAAFVFGLFTTAAVYLLSLRDGASSTIMLVLTGIARGQCVRDRHHRVSDVRGQSGTTVSRSCSWQLGSVAGASWNQVWAAPLIVAGCAGALALSHKLDLLALGDVQAASLGVNVEVVRRQAIVPWRFSPLPLSRSRASSCSSD